MRAREFIISEAMTRSQYRVLRNKSDFKFIKDRYNEIFDGKWRVSIPFDHYPDKSDYERFKSMSPEEQEAHVRRKSVNARSVYDALANIGYDMTSYINGLAVENEYGYIVRARKLYNNTLLKTKNKSLDDIENEVRNEFGLGYGFEDTEKLNDYSGLYSFLRTSNIKKDTRPKKIGGLLANNKEILKLFVNDPARKIVEPTKKIEFSIVISRHPVDIGAMSTNQKWSSCMRLPAAKDPNDSGGVNCRYVPVEISIGSIIAYLTHRGYENFKDKDPEARILIKPYINNNNPDDVALGIEGRAYSSAAYPEGTEVIGQFKEEVQKWIDNANILTNKKGIYNRHDRSYADRGDGRITVNLSDLEKKVIEKPSEVLRYLNTDIYGNLIMDDITVQDAFLRLNPSYLDLVSKLDFQTVLKNIKINPKLLRYIHFYQFNDDEYSKLLEVVILNDSENFLNNIDPNDLNYMFRLENVQYLMKLLLKNNISSLKNLITKNDFRDQFFDKISKIEREKYIEQLIEKDPLSFSIFYDVIDNLDLFFDKVIKNIVKIKDEISSEPYRLRNFYSVLFDFDKEKFLKTMYYFMDNGINPVNNNYEIRNLDEENLINLIVAALKKFPNEQSFTMKIRDILEDTAIKYGSKISDYLILLIKKVSDDIKLVQDVIQSSNGISITEENFKELFNIFNDAIKRKTITFSDLYAFINLGELDDRFVGFLVKQNKKYFLELNEKSASDLVSPLNNFSDTKFLLEQILSGLDNNKKIEYVKNLLGIIEQNLLKYINNSPYLRIEDYLYELTLKEVLESPVPLDAYYNYWGSKPIYDTKNTFRSDKTENNEYNRLAGLVADKIINQLKFSKDPMEKIKKVTNNADFSNKFYQKFNNLLKHSEDHQYVDSIFAALFFNLHMNTDYKEKVSKLNDIKEQIKTERGSDIKFGGASLQDTRHDETMYKQLRKMITPLSTFMNLRDTMIRNPRIKGIDEPIRLIEKLHNLFWKVRRSLDSSYDKGDGDLENYYNEVYKWKKSKQS
jgi:hypothetical protein